MSSDTYLRRRSQRHLSEKNQRESSPKFDDDNKRPDQPLHVAQDSLFSTSSGYTNYKGFFNLSMLLLVCLENYY